MMMDEYSLAELNRRLANIVRVGKVIEAKDRKARIRIGKVETDFMPILSLAGETNAWIPMSIGEQVMVLCPYGEFSQSVILRSIHYNDFKKPTEKESENIITFKDKTTASYDPETHILDVKNEEGELKTLFKECLFEMLKEGITLEFKNDTKLKISENKIELKTKKASIDVLEENIACKTEKATIDLNKNDVLVKTEKVSMNINEDSVEISQAAGPSINLNNNGVDLESGSASFSLYKDEIVLNSGASSLTVGSRGIFMNNGASDVEITSSNISITSGMVDIFPPVCMHAGGF